MIEALDFSRSYPNCHNFWSASAGIMASAAPHCGSPVVRYNGISSYEIHREIGVTQKTAWFIPGYSRSSPKVG
ncbi:MAG: hypothetical protein OXI74_21990 [Rhodospirillaceae bacterium]|nr:hypothetical protein [Rhodospirillaceae bacterium]